MRNLKARPQGDGSHIVEVDSLGEAIDFVQRTFRGRKRLVFRGQSDHRWDVSSTLYREQMRILELRVREKLRKQGGPQAARLAQLYSSSVAKLGLIDLPPDYDESLLSFARNVSMLSDPVAKATADELINAYRDYTHVYSNQFRDLRGAYQVQADQAIVILEMLLRSNLPFGDQMTEHSRRKLAVRDALNQARNKVASLAQHYGLPTHLVDFTKTLPAAAFFASITSQPHRGARPSIDILDVGLAEDAQYKWIDSILADLKPRLFEQMPPDPTLAVSMYVQDSHEFLRKFINGYRFLEYSEIHPLNVHQRSQQGVMIAMSAEVTLRELLEIWQADALSPILTRVVLKKLTHEQLEDQCRTLGMTHATAFNTLGGYAADAKALLRRDLAKFLPPS